jgi:Tol biopolymer transport system component
MVKYPQWSNDGRFIAFVGRLPAEENDKLMLLEVKTGRLTQLPTAVRWHGQISWWFDDSAVIFSHNGDLFSIDIESKQVQQLTTRGGVWAQMPDANHFYFSKGRNRGLWQLLPNGQEIQLLSGKVFSSRTAWTVANNRIYFLQQKPGQLLVSYYDVERQEIKDLILLPPDQLRLQSVISFDTKNQRLLFELSMLPRADIEKMYHPHLE